MTTVRFGDVELPEGLVPVWRKAVRLEWVTIGFLVVSTTLMYLVLGSSQAMRAAWIEDLLSFLPPTAFLVAGHLRRRRADSDHPFAYHRTTVVAYLLAGTALLTMGAYLTYDGTLSLVRGERPPIGTVVLLGQQVWLGWVMLPALAFATVGPVLIGRAKLPLSQQLHDKVLYADADMQKADWRTAVAAAVGVVGIAFGAWWTDSAAAAVIGASVLKDGWKHVRTALADLLDARPAPYDDPSTPHPVIGEALRALRGLDWVDDARVRVRELGHLLQAEAFLRPRPGEEPTVARLADARDRLDALDWKLHDVVVTAVEQLPVGNEPGGHGDRSRG